MSEYVGLVKGKVHDKCETSEYYCGCCGYPVTDHDSYCRECGGELHEGMDKSRWHKLFGTPEMAARTLLDACDNCGQDECSGCQVYELTQGGETNYDALLEWLKGASDGE